MGSMDTTRTTELLTELAEADPADAPDLADELAATLADTLDGSQSAAPGPDTSPAETAAP